MPRFKKMIEREDGWTDWQFPLMKGYRMGCCDCGLVHDMEFVIAEVSRTKKNGTFTATELPQKKYRVKFRAKRNNRSTAAMKRSKP